MIDNFKNIVIETAENLQNNRAFVLATVLKASGGTPGRSGFKMIVYPDETTCGTVGGGLIEQRVKLEAKQLFTDKTNKILEFDLNGSINEKSSINTEKIHQKIDMQCGGSTSVFMEYYAPQRSVYLFGAGHLCQSIVPILKSLDFYTIVIDDREDYADKSRLPGADLVICTSYIEYALEFCPGSDDSVIIFTHAHSNDYSILQTICSRDLKIKYTGMIASQAKARENLKQLQEAGIEQRIIQSIHTPIGLNIAKTTTSEIAISITSELIAVYNNISKICSLSQR